MFRMDSFKIKEINEINADYSTKVIKEENRKREKEHQAKMRAMNENFMNTQLEQWLELQKGK